MDKGAWMILLVNILTVIGAFIDAKYFFPKRMYKSMTKHITKAIKKSGYFRQDICEFWHGRRYVQGERFYFEVVDGAKIFLACVDSRQPSKIFVPSTMGEFIFEVCQERADLYRKAFYNALELEACKEDNLEPITTSS